MRRLDNELIHGRLEASILLPPRPGMQEVPEYLLGRHVEKGIGERANQGLHLSGTPFGYGFYWIKENGAARDLAAPNTSLGFT